MENESNLRFDKMIIILLSNLYNKFESMFKETV